MIVCVLITLTIACNNAVMEEAIPVDTSWVRPKKNLKSSQHKKDEFLKDLEKTKQVLARSSSIALKKIPSRQNSLSSQNSSTSLKKSNKLFLAGGMNSLSEDDISLPEKSMSEDSHSSALGAMRDWRGVSETSELECKMSAGSEDFSVNTPKPSSARKLSVMLRSTGGTNRFVTSPLHLSSLPASVKKWMSCTYKTKVLFFLVLLGLPLHYSSA